MSETPRESTARTFYDETANFVDGHSFESMMSFESMSLVVAICIETSTHMW